MFRNRFRITGSMGGVVVGSAVTSGANGRRKACVIESGAATSADSTTRASVRCPILEGDLESTPAAQAPEGLGHRSTPGRGLGEPTSIEELLQHGNILPIRS